MLPASNPQISPLSAGFNFGGNILQEPWQWKMATWFSNLTFQWAIEMIL